MRISISLLFVGLTLLTACSTRTNHSPIPSISKDAKADLARPVNCRTAQYDIAVLEKESAGLGKQVLAGVRSVLPISIVAGILMGDYRDRTHVAIGSYNKDIKAKIAVIKETCHIK